MSNIPILGPLFALLVCLAKYVVGGIIWAVVSALNLVIAALFGVIGALLSLLPSVDLPTLQTPTSLALANRYLPLTEIAIAVPIVLSVLLAWHVAVPLLRKLGVVS